jgi:hypothetical protein
MGGIEVKENWSRILTRQRPQCEGDSKLLREQPAEKTPTASKLLQFLRVSVLSEFLEDRYPLSHDFVKKCQGLAQ